MSEVILGVIPATFPRRIGFERLGLYVTDRRIIIAHESRKGLGALALTPLLGRYSGSTDESAKDLGKRAGSSKARAKSPENVLAAHKDNFALSFEELVSVELREKSGETSVTILTRSDKFQFTSDMDLKEAVELLSPILGTKLAT